MNNSDHHAIQLSLDLHKSLPQKNTYRKPKLNWGDQDQKQLFQQITCTKLEELDSNEIDQIIGKSTKLQLTMIIE